MPFDGILFGSIMMAAKECRLSDQGKQALVDAVGILQMIIGKLVIKKIPEVVLQFYLNLVNLYMF